MRAVAMVMAAGLAAGAAAAQTPAPAKPIHAGGDPPPGLSNQITYAVANPFRPMADIPHDADRRPGETLSFAGVTPGSKVIELAPTDGYFSQLLYSAVGPMGTPYLYTPKATDAVKAWSRGAGGARLIEKPLMNLATPEHIDVVFSWNNFHEFHNQGPLAVDVPTLLKRAYMALKPGGVLFIVDYAAAPGAPAYVTQTLGRIDPGQVVREVQAAGFVFDSESSLLANPADPHTAPVSQMGEKADRMMLKFVKPGVAGQL